ncbi:MAG TPA: Fic family protein [Acidimicrobiales bacterium]|nr:Fic family protein [Acidimicrobiales bacterium]
MSTLGPREEYQPLIPVSRWNEPDLSPAWHEFLALLGTARAKATEQDLDRAVEFTLRSAALETGAIEGLYAITRGITRTVALQGAMWEAALDEIGPDVRGHFDAQLEALEHVLDVATQRRPITEVWLRELHAVTCRGQKTYRVRTAVGPQDHELNHGEYKTESNHVVRPDGSPHFYCPVHDVRAEMARLVEELGGDGFATLHPAGQAACAHHAFTSIHPFADGNGRVARALASVFLYRSVGVPLVLFSDRQERYWDALLAADHGRHEVFVHFIEDRATDTMAMIANRLREAAEPLSAEAATIHSLMTAHGGLTYAELEACGQRLTAQLQASLVDTADETLSALSQDVRRSIQHKGGKIECHFGRPYHTLQQGGGFTYSLLCEDPVHVGTEMTPIVGVSDSTDQRFAYIVVDANRPKPVPLLLRTDDLHPASTAAADERIRSWVSAMFHNALADLRRGVEQGLRGRGFDFPAHEPIQPLITPGPGDTLLLKYLLPKDDHDATARKAINLAQSAGYQVIGSPERLSDHGKMTTWQIQVNRRS